MKEVEVARLISGNSSQAQTYSVKRDMSQITIGRSSKCNIVIVDSRICKKHCVFYNTLIDDERIYYIENHSPKGTFINGAKSTNGLARVEDGDNITLIDPKLIRGDKIVVFTLCTTEKSLKRKRKSVEPQKFKKTKKGGAGQLVDDLSCGICLEIMDSPVLLLPCLHAVRCK